MGSAYQPDKVLDRFEYQIRETYPRRLHRRRRRSGRRGRISSSA